MSVNCCLSLLNCSMTSYRFRERFISSLHTRFKLINFSPYNANESKDEACVKCDCVKEWLSSHQSRTIILFDTRGKYLSKLLDAGVGHNSKEMKAIFSCSGD